MIKQTDIGRCGIADLADPNTEGDFVFYPRISRRFSALETWGGGFLELCLGIGQE